jgi:O-acetyl-ADP-ribose deacetylase (regulator of RNase III)
MQGLIGSTRLELVQGDITLQTVDAIVNAANESLLGGSGVDGAVHKAAGPALLACTRTLGGCPTGDARVSPAYGLKARLIVHAVGPRYTQPNAPALLSSAYQRSLEAAAEHDARTIAFPAISTGVYGYPMAEAAAIALKAVVHFAATDTHYALIRFVLFDAVALVTFRSVVEHMAAERTGPVYLLSGHTGPHR